MTLHEDDAVLLYFWLDGYLYHERELSILDLAAAAKAIAHMAEYCAANPGAPLRDALLPPAPTEEPGRPAPPGTVGASGSDAAPARPD